MEDVIRVENEFYILATSSRADERTQVLKHGETFAVFDHYGNILPFGLGEQGIYHEGTRFLSRLDLRVGKRRPLLLSSTVKEDNDLLTVDLTNPDMSQHGDLTLPRGTLHLLRSKFLWKGTCYERLLISNHGLVPVELSLTFLFDADFADIFEVRGMKRDHRGQRLPDHVEGATVSLLYRGRDGIVRRTRISWDPAPGEFAPGVAHFEGRIGPQGSATYYMAVSCQGEADGPPRLSYHQAFAEATGGLGLAKSRMCQVSTSNEQFNAWLARSVADSHMMITETPSGPYPYAGVPWFSTTFGRDGIITALELLWLDPGVARGVLSHLAATQALHPNEEEEAEPGKILHEARKGEMANLKEIPFGCYYGSADSTPLFVILAGAYYQETGDRAFLESLWPSIERALGWIDVYGDSDRDGFVEYSRRSPRGLIHQGWKDSHDSVFHADGQLAEGPVAICEVQAYVYAAKRRAAEMASALGQRARAEELRRQARDLRDRFEKTFWCEDLATYALALDGQKKPCRVRASNAGHCLFAGIASARRARQLSRTLFDPSSYSGWGLRTIASSEARYNPMSYHNGSVWPHDNTLIAAGFARYGLNDLVLRLLTDLFEASNFFDLHRLPELFCGFPRRPGEGPTLYPVACAPQAWAAAAVFLFLQGILGLSVQAVERRVYLCHTILPRFLKSVEIQRLPVGKASLDLVFERQGDRVATHVLRKEGDVEVVAVK